MYVMIYIIAQKFVEVSKNKLKHFKEMLDFPNVFQKNTDHKGKWNIEFKNSNPIILELGCGKGEYTIGMAEKDPNKNYIGIDIKGARIYTGAKYALNNKLDNVRFLRMQVDHLAEYFETNEVSEIWITFADPFLPESDAKRRLTSPKFLEVYNKVLKPKSTINLKTDSDELFQYTLEVIEELNLNLHYSNSDIYASELIDERLQIKTYYEKKHLLNHKTIKYVRYDLNDYFTSS
jgi:tRNA (guanine-N7-)-methyltransferase